LTRDAIDYWHGNAMPVAFYKATAGVMPGTPAANAASCGKTAIDIDN